jgi:hypothetical protein
MNPRIILFNSFVLRLVSRINPYLDSNPLNQSKKVPTKKMAPKTMVERPLPV